MKFATRLKGLVIIIFVWVVLPLAAIYLNDYFNLSVFYYPRLEFVGWILFGTSMAITLHLIDRHFKTGRSTPVGIEEPKRLIADGLYKYSRNPMYIAILAMFLGRFFIRGDLLLFFLFIVSIPAFHLRTIRHEEPELRKKFGNRYKNYTKKVPRWFLK